MHLLLPALIRLFKVEASVDLRRAAIKTLTRLIPRIQVGADVSHTFRIRHSYFLNVYGPFFLSFTHEIIIFFKSGYWSYLCSCASLEACLGWV